jgi:Uma2 family endonuclease
MNARFELKMDRATFDRWVQDQEGRYEWKQGAVIDMNDVTRGHRRLVANFLRALSTRLDLDRWDVGASDFGVEADDWVRFPDLIVEPMDMELKGRRAKQPVVLVEVLSPSSKTRELIEKPNEYLTFESLEAYVVASQDEPKVWVWQRSGEDRQFPDEAIEISELSASLEIQFLGISVPLTELYRAMGQS